MPILIECDRTWSGVGVDNGWPNFWGLRLGFLAIHWLDSPALHFLGMGEVIDDAQDHGGREEE